MNPRTLLFYRLSLANYFALLGLFVIWAALFEPSGVSLWIPLLFRSLPILIFLPGLLSKNVRSFAWLCFVAMLYICYGVIKAVEYPNVSGVMGILVTLFALDIIAFALLYIRSNGTTTHTEQT